MSKPNLMGWTLMLLAGLAAGLGNLMMKKTSGGGMSGLLSLWFLGAMILFLVNVFLLVKSMHVLPASVVTPVVSGGNFMVVVIGAAIFFGESLNPWQYGGLAAILLGIVMVGRA